MKRPNPHLFIFAGEPSGDLHGGRLLKALKEHHQELKADGVGGPHLRQQGLTCVFPTEEFEVMGLSDVLLALPKLWSRFKKVRRHILTTNPQGVVLIDYPGFNLRLAKALRKKGYTGKIVQYISPTVWAHSRKRIDHMAKTLDLLLTIYPFEPPYFFHTPLRTEYVGNPLVEYVHTHPYDDHWAEKHQIPDTENLVALFPGSRKSEILHHLPPLLQAARLLKQDNPALLFAISCVKEESIPLIEKAIEQHEFRLNRDIFLVPSKHTYDLMRTARAAIAKSGTVTLELALHSCPTVVVYQLSMLNRFYARMFLRLNLSHYCIVNILQGREVFPELIEKGFTPRTIAEEALNLIRDNPIREACLSECGHLQEVLNDGFASNAAASKIAELL